MIKTKTQYDRYKDHPDGQLTNPLPRKALKNGKIQGKSPKEGAGGPGVLNFLCFFGYNRFWY